MGKKTADVRVVRQAGPAARAPDWRDQAACAHTDPELFFPESGPGVTRPETIIAKRICGGCPVRLQCLRWALDHGVTNGIWGGTTEDERRLLRTRVPAQR